MAKDRAELRENILFHGMSGEEIEWALKCLAAVERSYERNALILHAGDRTESLGLVLSGSVTVESNDMWGNRTILSSVGPGQTFAETYAILGDEPLLVDVRANENCRVLFLKVGSLKGAEPWRLTLLSNLLTISAHKNLHLAGRSFHISPKTVRGRVLAYLNSLVLRTGRNEFDIPFDRQQLADYLNLDRTALSKELGKMQREGIIVTRKKHFILVPWGRNS